MTKKKAAKQGLKKHTRYNLNLGNVRTTTPHSVYLKVTLLSIVGLLMFSIIIVLILSINKGLDFTDEGGFLLSYKNANLYKGGVYNYHIIISKLTNWLNPNIIIYRWLSHFLMLFSSLILAIGLHKWIKEKYKPYGVFKNFIFLFCFISIGNFLFYFTGLQTLHNNTLTNIFLQISIGIILYLFSVEPSRLLASKINLLLIIVIGIICPFSFFVKFSTGILQFGSHLILLFILTLRLPIRQIVLVASLFLVAVIAGFLAYFTFFQTYTEWKSNFLDEYSMLSDHSPKELIQKYLDSFFALINFAFLNFYWLIIFPLFIVLSGRFSALSYFKNKPVLINAILIVATLIFINKIYQFQFYRSLFLSNNWITGFNAYFYFVIIGFQLLLCLSILIAKKRLSLSYFKENLKKVILVLFLLTSPFMGAFGTANPLFLNVLIHIAPLFCLIVILTIELSKHINKPFFLSFFIIFPSIITTTQIIDGNINCPYYSGTGYVAQRLNYYQQSEPVNEIPVLKGIYLDKEKKKFLIDLKNIFEKNNYRIGYPILGFHMPGIVYSLEGISPGAPYFLNQPRDRKAFDRFELHNNPPIILLKEGESIIKDLYDQIIKKGIDLADYSLIGIVDYPNGSKLRILFPKSLLQNKTKVIQ